MSNLVLSDAGFTVYNMCINTKKRKEFLEHFRPEFPASLTGVSGLRTFPRRSRTSRVHVLASSRKVVPPLVGAEFPPLAKHSGPSAPEFWPESQL